MNDLFLNRAKFFCSDPSDLIELVAMILIQKNLAPENTGDFVVQAMDYIFVRWERREREMTALKTLAKMPFTKG